MAAGATPTSRPPASTRPGSTGTGRIVGLVVLVTLVALVAGWWGWRTWESWQVRTHPLFDTIPGESWKLVADEHRPRSRGGWMLSEPRHVRQGVWRVDAPDRSAVAAEIEQRLFGAPAVAFNEELPDLYGLTWESRGTYTTVIEARDEVRTVISIAVADRDDHVEVSAWLQVK